MGGKRVGGDWGERRDRESCYESLWLLLSGQNRIEYRGREETKEVLPIGGASHGIL